MPTVRDTKDKIDKIDKQMEQLKARKQALLAKNREVERKKRTKRLIEIGAVVEKVLGELGEVERERFLNELIIQQDHFIEVLANGPEPYSETCLESFEDSSDNSDDDEIPRFVHKTLEKSPHDDFY